MNLKWMLVATLCCSLYQGRTRNIRASAGELLRNKMISDYLANLENLPISHPDKQRLITMIIESALRTNTSCLQANPDMKCLWTLISEAAPPRGKREVDIIPAHKTRDFLSTFVRQIAKKSFPQLSSQISSIFSNKSESFLKMPADTTSRFETASNLIILRSIQKMSEALTHLSSLKVPVLTLCSILIFLVILLIASCSATQISKWRIKRQTIKQAKLESYFNRRRLQMELNQRSPSYEAVQGLNNH